jgi:hypothetical protein
MGVLSALSVLYSLGVRAKQKISGGGEGQLNLWQALTFRFTVGGLSMMLLLNIIFWAMTATYLLREPIAHAMPGPIARIKVDETTTVKEALLGWRLYYTNVVDEERYSNVTVWNTTGAYVRGQISRSEAADRFNAIDKWSRISQIFYPIAIMLFVANFIFILLGLISCQKRGNGDLFPFALLVPFYWVLISIAAIKGFWQLFWNPFYWEKTTHGLAQTPGDSSGGGASHQVNTVTSAAGE